VKKKILWLGLSFLLVAALVLTSCPSPAVEEEKLRFAYVHLLDPAEPFSEAVLRGWIAGCEALGVDHEEHSSYGDVAKAVDLIDAMIAAEVDGIYVFSHNPEANHPAIARAVAKGIPFVVMSTRDPVFGSDVVPYVGLDMVAQGYTLGRDLAARLIAAGLVSDVNIAVFCEVVAAYSIDRWQGITTALDEAGIGYIAEERFGVGLDMATILDMEKTHLIAYPETDVLISLGSIVGAAGVMALQELGFAPGEIMWTGFDLVPEIAEAVRLGYGATNVDEVFGYGFLGAMAVYMRAKHGMIVGDVSVATTMVDQANVEDFYEFED